MFQRRRGFHGQRWAVYQRSGPPACAGKQGQRKRFQEKGSGAAASAGGGTACTTREFLLFFLGKGGPCCNAGEAFVAKGVLRINAPGSRAAFRRQGRGMQAECTSAVSKARTVQALRPVPCARRRCASASHRRWKGGAAVLPGLRQGQTSLCVAEALSVQALESPAQGHPGGPRLASAEESGMIACFSRYVIFFFITIRIRYAGYHKKRRGAAHHGS